MGRVNVHFLQILKGLKITTNARKKYKITNFAYNFYYNIIKRENLLTTMFLSREIVAT